MQPTLSFRDHFSSEGRVKKLLIEALRETDPQKSLTLLRSVHTKLCEPPAFVQLWLPFLDAFLARERVSYLQAANLADIEKMGRFLQQEAASREAPPALAIWQRLIEAYNARGEHALACHLAEKLCRDASSNAETRTYCLRELARQGRIEEHIISLYMAYLRTSPNLLQETQIFQALDTFFTIDFSASEALLTNIHRVAQSLLTLSLPNLSRLLPHMPSARGLYTLLVKSAPEEARAHFEDAYQLNQSDRIAVLGLLACEIRLGKSPAVAQRPSLRNLLADPEIAALLDLHSLIRWFDQPEVASPFLLDADRLTRLAAFPFHRFMGEIAAATLGCAHLLLGQVQPAREQFDLLPKNALKRPRWGYYAAWAYSLCGAGARVVNCFEQLISWPGRWTIACLLLDLDTRLAEQSGAVTLLKNIAASQTSAAPVVRARLALAQTGTATDEITWTETDFSHEERLEALRTGLAQALAHHDLETAKNLLSRSWFARLPLADQIFWRGLVERDQDRRLALLEQAASNWQYQRAALYLLVHSLRQRNWRQAARYKDQALAGRTDATTQLIRLYIQGREAQLDEAIQQGEQQALLGTERAFYILGHLYFYKAAAEPQQAQQARLSAALAWQRLLVALPAHPPADLAALAACAAFIAYPQQRESSALTLIQSFQMLDISLRQPWLEWHVALALLWYGSPQALSDLYITLVHAMGLAERADAATIAVLALALTTYAYKLKESLTTPQFLELLERFAQQGQWRTNKHLLTSTLIAGQRSLYLNADEHQRPLIEDALRLHLARDPRNSLLLLWQVSIALHNGRREVAATLLQSVPPDEPAIAYLAQELLHLLNHAPRDNSTGPAGEQLSDLSRDALSVASAVSANRLQDVFTLLLRQNTNRVLATLRLERILPSLCLSLQQNGGTPPASLTSFLHRWQPETTDGATLIRLARCAALLGNVEDACRLWEEALSRNADDEQYTRWRQDFVRFLCHQAVNEHTSGLSFEAASKLRLAAHWTMPEFGRQLSQERLLEHARTLELRALTSRLLSYLFPDFTDQDTSPGRYHALGLALASSPSLTEALINRDRERIEQEWQKTLREQDHNICFLHTLSVLYREVALFKQAQYIDTEKDWMTSTTLWLLLFSTDAFWQYFAEERHMDEEGEPRKLSIQQREELWQDALDNILVFHSTIARKSLAAGEYSQARIHARCLALGRQTSRRLLEILAEGGLVSPLRIEQKRLERIKSQTLRLLNEWGQSLLTEAEQRLNDANSIAELPSGIRKHYKGAIDLLTAFIRLDVPLIRILLTCLDWYNEWCSDLSHVGTRMQYRATTEAAGEICEKLQRRCNKKDIYAAENKAIALHLLYRGHSLTTIEPERAVHFYEEARAWGSEDPYLDEMVESARLRSLEDTALDYANKQQFGQAYEAIAQNGPVIKQQDAVRGLHMRICFRHARELVAQEKYTEALSRGKQALALEPDNTILQHFISEVEELIPEEGNALFLHEAERALQEQDFRQALQQLARIPPGSRLFPQAQELRQQALQQQSEATADEEELDEERLVAREEELRVMLASERTDFQRPKAREELARILARLAASELRQATLLNNQQEQPSYRPRLIYAQSLYQEALELDPRHAEAKQALEDLKKLLERKEEKKKEEKA